MLEALPKDTMFQLGGDTVSYDPKKGRFVWQGWDYYNDDEGYREWFLDTYAEFWRDGNKVHFRTARDVEAKSGWEEWRGTVLKVYFPAKNLNFYPKKS